MGKARILVLSGVPSDVEKTTRELDHVLQKKGCKVAGPEVYPVAPFSEMRCVVNNFNSPSHEKYNWLKPINSTSSDYLLDCGAEKIHGRGFIIQSRVGVDVNSIVDSVNPPKGTTVQSARGPADSSISVSGHTPFSYDPAQDYYTEPDR
ncbi:hypothetical protein [Haloferax volcanii]|uniref:hypothetical protein n=1 Tax=Haloferax volcanii TaxID=2246 RepID=UPI0023DA8B68|nr:hypothetical protein [Haloferax lucentense]